MSGTLTLVIGGAASGKSAYAENLLVRTGKARVYVATARVLDREMERKVERHKNMRGAGWDTREAPIAPEQVLSARKADECVLLDCATMWLMNHLMDESDMEKAEADLLQGIADCRADVVVVTNELGLGIVPADPLSRRFRQAQGELNQRLAAQANAVVNVIAGLPQILKGVL
ncbi:bifunctional adenosylcobinamide kinase/adenosylcobinamide-phosphate guanylyltransferase [Planktotalea arctica]|uniref:bifunctional adenosylcobinamide kinase/adenosylcobinamide-phosphate guanylyltransferase n=1 Tax=Planktotalea arctica TaxID=1481893 RepID=UPI000A170068|nr:bifunctional adenosylcobinamide kinase/adenosylcobinamide-phosphate guanylyltransferase [Planktotalea arctica]